MALPGGQRQRLGQGGLGGGFLAAGRQRQRLQGARLDDVARTALGGRSGKQLRQEP
jgi:hypothetical protein